jgi:hypothetical protein
MKETEILYYSIYCHILNKGVKIPFKDVNIYYKTKETDIDSFTSIKFSFNCKCGNFHVIKTGENI